MGIRFDTRTRECLFCTEINSGLQNHHSAVTWKQTPRYFLQFSTYIHTM